MLKTNIFSALLGLFLFSIHSSAQDTKHIAFVFKEEMVKHTWNKQLYEKIKPVLYSTPGMKANIYWRKEGDKELYFQKDSMGNAETMSAYVAYVKSDIKKIPTEELIVRKDNEGKITSVLYEIKMDLDLNLRLIDLSTSEILREISIDETELEELSNRLTGTPGPKRTVPIDYKKYFKGAPDDSDISKDQHAAILKKIRLDYAKDLWANQKAQLEYIMSHVGDKLNRVLRSEVVSMNFKLSPGAETDMEKLKDLILQGGKNSGVEDSEHISVFVKKKIQDTYHWMPAGSVYVHEVQDNTARVSHTGRNAEEEMLAEALKDDAEIVVTYSDLPSLELPQNDKAINLAVKRKSVFQDISSENLEHRLPGARLIERAPDYDLEYFLEKAKEERFMDQTGIDQESQIGAEYLMETTVEKYKLIDIKSSKILFDAERFISLTGLQSKYDFLNKWNEFFDVGMELIEVMDGNEKKVKEVMVQSLLDLRKITYLDVFHVQSESVGGKSIERLVKVGQLWPKKDLGGNMFECKVTDGNKELRELIDAGEDLIIKIKVKKGKEAGKLKKLMLEAAKEAERSK